MEELGALMDEYARAAEELRVLRSVVRPKMIETGTYAAWAEKEGVPITEDFGVDLLAVPTAAIIQVLYDAIRSVRDDPNAMKTLQMQGAVNLTDPQAFAEAFAVQPFSNLMVAMDLTGAQLKAALEQQFVGCGQPVNGQKILQVSAGFTYSWSASAACGSKISNMMLNGTPIDLATTYRVTVNNFLAGGGDNFTAFTAGTNLYTSARMAASRGPPSASRAFNSPMRCLMSAARAGSMPGLLRGGSVPASGAVSVRPVSRSPAAPPPCKERQTAGKFVKPQMEAATTAMMASTRQRRFLSICC